VALSALNLLHCGPVLRRRCCWAPGARRCRSISPARGAPSSKPAARHCCGGSVRQTDRRTQDRYLDPVPHTVDFNDISFPSHYLPSRTVVLDSFYCLGHFKNVYDDDDDDDDTMATLSIRHGVSVNKNFSSPRYQHVHFSVWSLGAPLSRLPPWICHCERQTDDRLSSDRFSIPRTTSAPTSVSNRR